MMLKQIHNEVEKMKLPYNLNLNRAEELLKIVKKELWDKQGLQNHYWSNLLNIECDLQDLLRPF